MTIQWDEGAVHRKSLHTGWWECKNVGWPENAPRDIYPQYCNCVYTKICTWEQWPNSFTKMCLWEICFMAEQLWQGAKRDNFGGQLTPRRTWVHPQPSLTLNRAILGMVLLLKTRRGLHTDSSLETKRNFLNLLLSMRGQERSLGEQQGREEEQDSLQMEYKAPK